MDLSMFKKDFVTEDWKRRINFSALAGWLILSLALAVISYLRYGEDFRGYFAATRVLLAGGNPYDYHLVAKELLYITGKMGNNPYYYPPWFAWLFIPLSIFPFQIARAIWMAINVVVWTFSIKQLSSFVDWPKPGWQRYLFFMLGTFSFAWITWRYEQIGVLIFAMLVAIIISIQGEKWLWSGIWMTLLLIKPNITLMVVAGICLWLVGKRIWQPIIVMVLTLFVLLAISTLITPNWYAPFFEDGFGQGLKVALDGPGRVVALRINTTFLDWLATMNIVQKLRVPIYGIIIVVGLVIYFWAIYRSENFLQMISIILLVSYALTPYALQYDFPPLTIVLFWGLKLCSSISPRVLHVGMVLTGFIASVLFWQQNISFAYWIVVGLIVLVAWGMYQKNKTAPMRGSSQ